MDQSKFGQAVILTIGLYMLMTTVAMAAGGTELIEFTGGVEGIFSALRGATIVRVVSVGVVAVVCALPFFGMASSAWAFLIGPLLGLGLWNGAEPISDAIFTAGVVF